MFDPLLLCDGLSESFKKDKFVTVTVSAKAAFETFATLGKDEGIGFELILFIELFFQKKNFVCIKYFFLLLIFLLAYVSRKIF